MALTLHLVGPISHSSHTITQLSVTTTEGDMTIHKNHAPMITYLAANHEIVYTTEDNTQERTQVAGGIVHIERETVTIIMDI